MSKIIIKDAVKKYGEKTVIKSVNLEIQDGEFFTLLGPSGCGKTTLLRMIAGFNSIEGGEFYFNDTLINNMDPSKRNIGMVFQNYAVFPNMTVRGNIEFGLKERKVSKAEMDERVEKILDIMKIREYADRKPQNLSGGQQQRVALARAIVIEPDVLLMDEPLSNLDAKLRVDLREEIRRIQKEIGITTVYVTHDQEEAMAVSDRIAVMKDGVIEQCDKPRKIYHKPNNLFVASFIGTNNVLSGNYNAENKEIIIDSGEKFSYDLGNQPSQRVKLSIRPEDFRLDTNGDVEAKINDEVFLGSTMHYNVELKDKTLLNIMEESKFEEISRVNTDTKLRINLDKINVFNEKGDVNLNENES
ncbi:ABC transporter ATP-binding protein [Anaerococcus degeneri]|uniref:ABC transporter ATP-binding protein n=1 Tax=Anaerococcus degeneri TaxID=361500 RepID=A0ABS7YWJ5_9FIRM|nr:ABC transporter ATP-binding protein [Anaerococcus degeneri]MBP2015754.1 iron(III) transport system ATP-binding protein [Anaerococcus degeneri]MCA2096112.1 ABC transporter ATP-binding protein [Anaerococcus degeneri]